KWKRLSLLFCLFLVFQACKESSETRLAADIVERDGKIYYSGSKGNEVVAHILSDPGNLHPINSRFANMNYIMAFCYQKLMSVDLETGEQIPDLAAGLPEVSADGLTFTFEVHPDAAWDDGAPITAEDILFSHKVVCSPFIDNQNLKPYLEFIESITLDPANPKRFEVKMKEFFLTNADFGFYAYILDARTWDADGVLKQFALTDLLAQTDAVMNSEALKQWSDEFNDPKWGREIDLLNSGTGPYKMESWEEGASITLVRNDDFWAAGSTNSLLAQNPDRLEFKVLNEEQAIELQIKQEEIDLSMMVSTETMQKLMDDPETQQKYHLETRSRATTIAIVLNNQPDGVLQKPIFGDKITRQALAHATPLDQVIAELMSFNAKRTTTPISPDNAHYYGGISPIPFDLAKAGELLDQAGWTGRTEDGVRVKTVAGEEIPFRFRLMFPPNGEVVLNMLNQFQATWKQVGIDCELAPMTMADYFPLVREQEFDAALFGYGVPSYPYDFKQLYSSESYPDGDNLAGFSNAEADSLMEVLRVEPDLAVRRPMAQRVQEIIYEEQPILFLYNPTRRVVLHKRYNNGQIYNITDYVMMNNLQVLIEE
ncbi:MAG: ABC transporter substrate-binding protein, partial [Bacteroidota bacterium]